MMKATNGKRFDGDCAAARETAGTALAHPWRSRAALALLGLGALAVLAPRAARADVITYQNGRVIAGIIDDGPPNADVVTINTETGKLTVPKARIKDIKRETKSEGYVRIGQAYLGRQDFPEALQAFQQALTLDPNNKTATQMLGEAQAKIASQQQASRDEALSQVDKLSDQATQLTKQGEFEKAEGVLKEANKLVPSPEQREKLTKQISDLYLAWADERQDKLDPMGAEDKLNLALAANPNNEAVVDRMLKLWENDPSKREQTANIYETILERHPDDKTLRKKLGDLYFQMGRGEDAIHHYLALYQSSDKFKGTEVEKRLIDQLRQLHLDYARKGDYDQAIKYFNVLATIDPETNPGDVVFYEFFRKVKATDPNDGPARLALAREAEAQGMDQEALGLYQQLAENPKMKPEAQAGIDRYAAKALEAARIQFQSGNYQLAAALAQQVASNFPNSLKTVEGAAQLVGQAQVQAQADRRQKRELARDVVQRADQFYDKAWSHLNNMTNTERKSVPGLYSDRTMARQYLQLAIDAYQEALRIDPSLGTEAQSLVNVRLNECRSMLARVNTGAPSMPYNFGTPLKSVR